MTDFLLRPDRFFLGIGLTFGLLLLLLTPPFQVPDEPMHFYRACHVSQGELFSTFESGYVGGLLPAQVRVMTTSLTADVPFHPEKKVMPGAVSSWLRTPLDSGNPVFVDFRNTSPYAFVAYLPQAAALAAGRILRAPLLVSFYAARLADLLLATVLTWYAIRQAPGYRWLLAMIALTPMAVFERASISIDSLVIATGFLAAATAAKLAWGEESSVRRRDFAILTATSVVLCLAKPVYVLLWLAILLVPAARFPGGRRRRWRLLLVHGFCLGLAFFLAMANANRIEVSLRPDMPTVDSRAQVRDALAEPFRFFGVVVRDYIVHSNWYLAQFIGQLGWLDAKLPLWFLKLYLALLAGLALLGSREPLAIRPWQRVVLAGCVLATLGMISASQYAIWTPYRLDVVEGLQGRYFLPVAPAGIWVVYSRRFADKVQERTLGLALFLFTVLSLGITTRALLERYYG